MIISGTIRMPLPTEVEAIKPPMTAPSATARTIFAPVTRAETRWTAWPSWASWAGPVLYRAGNRPHEHVPQDQQARQDDHRRDKLAEIRLKFAPGRIGRVHAAGVPRDPEGDGHGDGHRARQEIRRGAEPDGPLPEMEEHGRELAEAGIEMSSAHRHRGRQAEPQRENGQQECPATDAGHADAGADQRAGHELHDGFQDFQVHRT